MHALSSRGAAIHYRIDGPSDGPALALLNSLGTDNRIWDGMISHLPSGVRAVRYDKRGHGLSDCPPENWGLDAHVDDLEAVLDAAGATRVVLVGLSIGGLIAQSFAARRPSRVSGLALMCTAAKIGSAEMWASRMAAVEEGGMEQIGDGVLERWFTAEFRETAPDFPLYRNMLLRTPAHGYLQSCAALRDADLTDAAPRLTAPTLAIAGSEDGATPPALVEATARMIPGARYAVIDNAGHLPCIERPEATAAHIGALLREIGHV